MYLTIVWDGVDHIFHILSMKAVYKEIPQEIVLRDDMIYSDLIASSTEVYV